MFRSNICYFPFKLVENAEGHVSMVEALLGAGADINFQTADAGAVNVWVC
jgi:hypothetical protein